MRAFISAAAIKKVIIHCIFKGLVSMCYFYQSLVSEKFVRFIMFLLDRSHWILWWLLRLYFMVLQEFFLVNNIFVFFYLIFAIRFKFLQHLRFSISHPLFFTLFSDCFCLFPFFVLTLLTFFPCYYFFTLPHKFASL